MTAADMFYKYEYTETKDLIKVFLTLLSATLVFSLTFAEKIVNFNQAHHGARHCLIIAWILFVSAIVSCGVSMVLIAAAAGRAVYGAIPLFDTATETMAIASWISILVAGSAFVLGLALLVAAAVISSAYNSRFR